jgi:hypothetical protein
MFDLSCIDCHIPVPFAGQPDEATCPECGLRLYVTADGQLGRIPDPHWQPGGIQGRLR